MHILTKTGLKKLFSKSTIPNSDGFHFLGFNGDGEKFYCEVVLGSDGVHRVVGMKLVDMVGWTNEVMK